jgi:hypothetical protein
VWTGAVVAGGLAATGVVLGWVSLQRPALDTLTVADSIDLWTSEPRAEFWLNWQLDKSGRVEITVTRSDGFTEVPAELFLVLACDARLKAVEAGSGYYVHPDTRYTVEVAGEEADCHTARRVHPRHQLITVALDAGEGKVFVGEPVASWTSDRNGLRIARTPYMSALAPIGEGADEPSEYGMYPRLKDEGAVVPERPPTFTGILLAQPSESREAADGPTEAEERLSNTVLSESDGVVESVSWSDTRGLLEPGVARWSNSGGEAAAQWGLLSSGVAFGVAASVVFELVLTAARGEVDSPTRRTAEVPLRTIRARKTPPNPPV